MSSLNFPETVESEFEADYWPPDRRASACSLPCHVAIPSSELNLEFPNDVYSVAGARKVCAFWTHLDEALGKEEAREMFDLTTARYTVRDDDETSNKRQCVRNFNKKISERTSNKNQNEKSFNREPFGNGKLKKDVDFKWVEDELNRFEIQNNTRMKMA
ncbi:hypothetical protein M8J76_013962 [Diaphorina citri]|nr:hypothetical protein M8J76_013962 [Diaphorina citri]